MAGPMPKTVGNRYQLKGEPIGRGGMGVVYRAYDLATQRDVALKTLKGVEPMALEMFRKEWTVLAQLSHPNIVDIIDSGQFEEGGETRPYFVMPLLPGLTLDNLIRTSSPRLTVARVVEMMAQTCKGLQAAHDRGLIHRDLKPSNLFIMDDDSVKLIDFGVVHLSHGQSVTGIKGSLPYMAPELLQMKPATPASDVFALGVVCYEALTGRNPFARPTESETIQALRGYIPPPVSEVNATASEMISRVVHKAIAKQAAYRFASAREFASSLQKALRNEAIEGFDRVRLGPRIERAKKACGEGDYQFAAEIIAEVESEGHIDPEIHVLRGQVELALRQRAVRQLLDSARVRLEEGEIPLAVQKLQEALEIDPENAEAKLLRAEAEQRRGERQIENWRRLVRQHMDNHLYSQARQALQEILKLDPGDVKAREMLASVDRLEQEFVTARKQKEELYQSAMRAYQGGEISSALDKLEHILALTRGSSHFVTADREAEYQRFYNQVRTERDEYRNAHTGGRKFLAERNFEAALNVCTQMLKRYPGDALFQALKLEVEEQQRQEQSAFVGEVNRRVEAEADLDRKYAILSEAAERFPKERHFEEALRLIRNRRELVNAIVAKARQYEERGQYSDALGQWDILRNIYGQYPGLHFEVERLVRRREGQVREEAKARWVQQIDAQIAAGEYARAQEFAAGALAESPEDRELIGLERLARQGVERSAEARTNLEEAQRLCAERRFPDAVEKLKAARALDQRNPGIRAALLNALLEQAKPLINQDWHAAEPLLQQALELDPYHPVAKSLRALVEDYRRQEHVEELICQARELQASGDVEEALGKVEEGLTSYPSDPRLSQLRSTLGNALPESRRKEMREQFLKQLKALVVRIDEAPEEETRVLLQQSRVLAGRYPEDPEFRTLATEIDRRAQASIARDRAPGANGTPLRPDLTQTLPGGPAESPDPWDAPAATTPAAGAEASAAGPPRKKAEGYFGPVIRIVRRVPPMIQGVVATAATLVVLALIFSHRLPDKNHKPGALEVAFQCRPDVAGAVCNVEPTPVGQKLKVGTTYQFTGLKDGYKTSPRSVTVSDKTPVPVLVDLHMEPEPVLFQVVSNLGSGKVTIDNRDTDLQDSVLPPQALAPGMVHTVKVMDGERELLNFSFSAEPGQLPVVTGPLQPANAQATVVSTLVSRAVLYASAGVKAAAKDQPVADVPPAGLPFDKLNPGNAEAQIDFGGGAQPLPIPLGNAPGLLLRLNSTRADQKVAFLTVTINIPEARVWVDNKPRSVAARMGSKTYRISPGPHVVRVTEEGYEEPPAQNVDIAEGAGKSVTFELAPVVTTATLMLENSTADAEVTIGSISAGKIGADGTLKREGIVPGSYQLVVQKQNYEDHRERIQFAAKDPKRMTVNLKPYGELVFHVTPANATVTYGPPGEAGTSTAPTGRVFVKAGSYEVSATAPDAAPRSQTFVVAAGQPTDVNWSLVPTTARKAPVLPPPPKGDLFDKTWRTTDDGWRAHSGQYGWLSEKQGSFEIELRKPKKTLGVIGHHIEWVVDYADERDRVNYSWDGDSVTRKEIVAGKSKPESKGALKPDSDNIVHFQLDISPAKIVVRQGDRVVDTLTRESVTELHKFGFKGDVEIRASRR
jgi:eukaryotic-like serine/threonine-protein kinase